jgi:hypothetical protein
MNNIKYYVCGLFSYICVTLSVLSKGYLRPGPYSSILSGITVNVFETQLCNLESFNTSCASACLSVCLSVFSCVAVVMHPLSYQPFIDCNIIRIKDG